MKTDVKDGKEEHAPVYYSQHPSLRKLTALEKKFLLAAEHGDAATVERLLSLVNRDPTVPLDINCRDPVGRSATLMAIDNENLEMLELLLEGGVESRDALLHAVNAEYVEAVDLLLEHEEIVHKEGEPHSWEKVDRDISTFTPEITPLILAAHKDNYEILKLLLDRGATLPMPHDVRCRCSDCVRSMEEDCLCHSRSRINAYRALSSPSLICLSSIDPILTAFELSWELRRLSLAENEFKEDYQNLRFRCQDFANALLDHARSSRELEVVLNYDPSRPSYQHGEQMPLTRIDMAIKYKQKKFIAHPNVQQLLSTLWYDGLPGFRRLNTVHQLWEIIKIGILFPFYSVIYMLFPESNLGTLFRKPFFKFITHSFAYLFFLFLLILASQRIETIIVQLLGTEAMKLELMESMKRQRGQPPTVVESAIFLFIIANVWQETRELWTKGLIAYFHNMWNVIDLIRNLLHVGTACLRVLAYIQAQVEISSNPMAVYIPREAWDAFDPMLIADGLFAAGNVFAALKLMHIFSINPYLGPLQISLGRMIIDIIKFFFIYTLVLFAFACGLNQLLWYYADMEKKLCFSGPDGKENWLQQRDACLAWRRFSNLFESSQTLFWASFGLVDISNFELTGIKSYTRFWGLLMFGSYSVINVVVLLNLLIAMMSNSYQLISEKADMEWKFARTKLFMNYFEEGGSVPPPFNIFPTVKNLKRLFNNKNRSRDMSIRKKETKIKERDTIYQNVMCNLVWRYVTAQQKAWESQPVTEDDINELRQDVSSFRHDLMHVLKCNGMNTKGVDIEKMDVPPGKKIQIRKRRLIKDFSIGLMEVCTEDAAPEIRDNKSVLARLVGLSGTESIGSQRWRELIQAAKRSKIIGNRDSTRRHFGSIKQSSTFSEHEENEKQNVEQVKIRHIEVEESEKSENSYQTTSQEKQQDPKHSYKQTPVTSQPQKQKLSECPSENVVCSSPSKTFSRTTKAVSDSPSRKTIATPSEAEKQSKQNITVSNNTAKEVITLDVSPHDTEASNVGSTTGGTSRKGRAAPQPPKTQDIRHETQKQMTTVLTPTHYQEEQSKSHVDTTINVPSSPEVSPKKIQTTSELVVTAEIEQKGQEMQHLIDFNDDSFVSLNIASASASSTESTLGMVSKPSKQTIIESKLQSKSAYDGQSEASACFQHQSVIKGKKSSEETAKEMQTQDTPPYKVKPSVVDSHRQGWI